MLLSLRYSRRPTAAVPYLYKPPHARGAHAPSQKRSPAGVERSAPCSASLLDSEIAHRARFMELPPVRLSVAVSARMLPPTRPTCVRLGTQGKSTSFQFVYRVITTSSCDNDYFSVAHTSDTLRTTSDGSNVHRL